MVQANPTRRAAAPQYAGLRLSADEFLALPDDGFKYQVINGVALMSPSPTPRHQGLLLELSGQFREYLRAHPVARMFPDIDVRFAPDLVYRPDIVVVRTERLPRPLLRIDVVPDLIVEIVSPGSESMDEQTKLADYQRFGVAEYWLVSPSEPLNIRILTLAAGQYVEAGAGLERSGGRTQSVVLPGLTLDLRAIAAAVRE